MRKILPGMILLAVMLGMSASLMAQSQTEIIKEKVDEALTLHLKKIYPPKSCDLNDCAFFYKGKMTVTKNQEVGKQLRLWGKAMVTYRNARTGGDSAVFFYAEVEKVDGAIKVTDLRWRTGQCMKFESIM